MKYKARVIHFRILLVDFKNRTPRENMTYHITAPVNHIEEERNHSFRVLFFTQGARINNMLFIFGKQVTQP